MEQMTLIQTIAIWALPVLFAITLHEVAHGYVAYLFGDHTARLAGRLTINPIKHIDPVGTILVPLVLVMTSPFLFGWAKPVPVDARNMSHPRYNMAIVALAGPLSNLLMAFFWGGIEKIGYGVDAWFGVPLVYMGEAGIMINLILCVLNCLPIPPLDGGRVLYNLLPPKMAWHLYRLEPYGFFILLLLIITGALNIVMGPPVLFLRGLIRYLFGL
jgi:Zn-dependent protease